ncbi:MAG TPA: 6-phosphogluconolactonase [Gemmatimonadaceae bacterium]|nr:6-phosphogluconolactonase [Gemmatimonadaceae bacterium]
MAETDLSIEVVADGATLAMAAAERIAVAARAAILRRKRFTIALAGGQTPAALYRLLAAEYVSRIQWRQVVVFFGDERSVPSHDPASNYAMAASTLLSHVPVSRQHVHRIAGEVPAADAARMYEKVLHREFPRANEPAFDLALLGLGADGHTASLFPGGSEVEEKARWAVPVESPAARPPRERVTLTLPILNRSREVLFLVSGGAKRDAATRILAGGASAAELPASRVRGVEHTLWLLDRDAAPAGLAG